MTLDAQVWVALGLVVGAPLVVVLLLLRPSSAVPRSRRRWRVTREQHDWAQPVVDWVDRRWGRTRRARRWAYALDRAGVRLQPAELLIYGTVLLAAAFALGYVWGGLFAALLTTFTAVIITLAFISIRADRRKAAFAELIDDAVQHISTNLRAGHSTLQSVETVGTEIDEPAKSELLRAVNQVRLGRDLGDALEETADRMDSDDFRWVAQAITIHRQVGGNLGEVLDTVSHTVRERQQVRRQVKAISAEGRMSAWVLIGLPIFVGAASAALNPAYASLLWTRPLGVAMLVYGAISMVLGALWIRKVVTVKF